MRNHRISAITAVVALGVSIGSAATISDASAYSFSNTYYGGTMTESPQYRSQRGRTSSAFTDALLQNSYYTNAETETDAKILSSAQLGASRVQGIFQRLASAGRNSVYDNSKFNTSQIDLQELIAHECFSPVRGEIIACKRRFGPYYNLKESLMNGTFQAILIDNNPDVSADMKMLLDFAKQQIALQNPQDDTVNVGANAQSDLDSDMRLDNMLFGGSSTDTLRARSTFVWEVCLSKYSSWPQAVGCYLRNKRMVTSYDAGLHIDASTMAALIK